MNKVGIFGKVKHIHMVGIGGAGMCGIAEVLLNLGFQVSGSDLQTSDVTDRLSKIGASIMEGHSEENIKSADVVVYSSAVRPENVELRAARDARIPTIPRSEMLAELMRLKIGIAVSGTHGKTTTTSMIGTVLHKAGLNPTLIVGGKVRSLDSHIRMGSGDILVAEADEFDRSFLKLSPVLEVITTVEAEHLDTYTDLEGVQDAFVEFANKIPFYGTVVHYGDDANIQAILPRIKRPVTSYGFSESCDYQATNILHQENRTTFNLIVKGESKLKFELQVPGRHNVLNALASIAIADQLEVNLELAKEALSEFTGVHRRFEIKGEVNGVLIVDDYAHHPTEIENTLKTALASWPNRRIVALFQPHLYSRTRDFASDFGKVLAQANLTLLADIYPSRERPIEGVTSELIAQEAIKNNANEVYLIGNDNLAKKTLSYLKTGDLLLVMGAGTITQVAAELANRA